MKVGDYVRTKSGYIDKIAGFSGDAVFFENDTILVRKSRMEEWGDKTSPNLIDLIEVGDYVNGCYVSNKRASVNEHLGGHPKGIGIIKCNAYFNQGNYNDCKFVWIEENAIESIVTKEQYEREVFRI